MKNNLPSLREGVGVGSYRFLTLAIVSITMMFAYFFTDVMSPLEPMLTLPAEQGGLGWTSDEYGFFSGSYGFFNVFLLLLFFGGIILDRFGIRCAGVLSTGLMLVGAMVKWWAVSRSFSGVVVLPFSLGTYSVQVVWACVGFALFGVGCEIAGITVSKVIVKWFTGYELAFAMGLQVALARIGTAAALAFSMPFAQWLGEVHHSVGLGVALLAAGMLSFLAYCVFDRAFDRSHAAGGGVGASASGDEGFRFSDLRLLVGNRGFWYIALLCLMFYAGVFPFLKFATKLMVFKYGVSESLAGLIPAMLPFGTIFLTPLFGSVYDRYGRGATLMLLGSVLLFSVHAVLALPLNHWVLAIVMMTLLGVSFGMVPSAMWPSVPKIIPMKLLGTAYALIFYIQNIGLSLVPVWIGKVNQRHTDSATGLIDYTETMIIFALFGLLAIVISVLLLREDRLSGYGLEQRNIL